MKFQRGSICLMYNMDDLPCGAALNYQKATVVDLS